MNIYLLKAKNNGGYDTFDSCIVIAYNEIDAKTIHPNGGILDIKKIKENLKNYGNDFFDWVTDISEIEVIYLGKAKNGSKRGVILASFNAG